MTSHVADEFWRFSTPSVDDAFASMEGGGYANSVACLPFFLVPPSNDQSLYASQGWGNVGAAAGFYLALSGVKVVAIIDQVGGVAGALPCQKKKKGKKEEEEEAKAYLLFPFKAPQLLQLIIPCNMPFFDNFK